ncbi:hypothetical protein BRC78_05375 [Halobacteriales archaeon QH_8_68_33]|nr:MAG: hypothetical protein BRC78_05375 [Halobacteriales archaeon QH_8_68_33]
MTPASAPETETGPDPVPSDVQRLGRALSTLKSDGYRHATKLVPISVVWFLASLPLVTIGPATVGAYAAISDVLTEYEADYGHVAGVLKRQSVAAFVLSLLPTAAGLGSVLYLTEFARTETPLAGMLALGSAYAAIFLVLVMIPTFVALSEGEWVVDALKQGYVETVSHATLSLTMAFLTLVLFVVTLLTTIGFALLFAGAAFTFHLALFAEDI